MADVVLEDLSRVFPGGIAAVDQLSLHVRDGELLVLVGPSGCGKTTTLRLIAGLEPVNSGDIRIAGRKVNRVAPRDRDVAMVFQSHALYPHLTVRQNLAFGLELRRGGRLPRIWQRRFAAGELPAQVKADETSAPQPAGQRRQIASRVEAAARTLGIESLLERMPAELSGGERQRVALGRALVRRPAVFLLDEPLSNLDALLRASLRSELKRLHQSLAATMMYVTHDQAEAMSLGDRIAILNSGRLQQIGAPLEVYRQPANQFVAGFLGSPPMNLCEAMLVDSGGAVVGLQGNGWNIQVERGWLPGSVPPGQIVWGVRPEDIRWGPPPEEIGRIRLSGQVNLIEPLGDTAIVHLAPPDRDMASPADQNRVLLWKTNHLGVPTGHLGAAMGERVEVWFEAAQLHWFDALTGRSIRGFETSKR